MRSMLGTPGPPPSSRSRPPSSSLWVVVVVGGMTPMGNARGPVPIPTRSHRLSGVNFRGVNFRNPGSRWNKITMWGVARRVLCERAVARHRGLQNESFLWGRRISSAAQSSACGTESSEHGDDAVPDVITQRTGGKRPSYLTVSSVPRLAFLSDIWRAFEVRTLPRFNHDTKSPVASPPLLAFVPTTPRHATHPATLHAKHMPTRCLLTTTTLTHPLPHTP